MISDRHRSPLSCVIWQLMLLSTLTQFGCSGPPAPDYSELGLIDVRGIVTLDGSPLSGATIRFEAQDGTFSTGRTNEHGQYRLMFNSEQSGVLPGAKTVRITMTSGDDANEDGVDREMESTPDDDVHSGGSGVRHIPERYGRKSELQIVVDSSHNEFPFELSSAR
jgi:hypothetical protein